MSVISTLPLDRLHAAHDAWHSTYAGEAGEAAKVAHHQITAGITAAGGGVECAFADPLVVDRAEGLSTEPETYDEDLPVEVVAALRQAWEAGVPLVDVASVLGPQGYEIRVLPCEPMDDAEDQFASLAGLDYEEPEDDEDDDPVLEGLASRLMDVLALSKGYSFETENRLIARNKKRKDSQAPHEFKASRYATRDGRVRCMMCGGPEPEKGSMCSGMTKAAPAKTEDGVAYPAEAFAYVPDPARPSTWKLRLWDSPEEKVTAAQVGRAIAALGPGGFRGNRVEIPAEDLPGVKRKILAAWRSVHDEGDTPPAILKAEGVRVGDFVSWNSSGGTARGRVEHVMTEGVFGVPDSDFSVRAEPGDPAVAIRVWEQGPEGWRETEVVVGHKASTLRRISDLRKAETYSPPQGVREAARRALDWIKDGKAGSNFTDVGRARAAQLARGDSVSRETIGRMRSYFARHEVDRQAEGFSSGEDGYPSPGRVAWDAWGGDAGRSWVNGLWERLEKSEIEGTYDPEDALNIRQKALYEAYEAIAEALGPWDGGIGAEGAHYIPADSNSFAEAGMKCANCVFFEGGGGCEILNMPVEPKAACKLWIIPEHLLSERPEEPEAETEVEESVVKATFVQKADERRYTMGPMYVPNMVDAHGEWTDPDELQKAVWDYVRAGDRRIRLQHNRSVVAGEWVEVLAWPYEVTVPMYGADMEGRKLTYPANTVFLGVVWEPWAWELIKAGKLRGYSIGGKADRVLADLPEGGE